MANWFLKLRRRPVPSLSSTPAGTIIYAIGDIHGRLDLLQQLEAKVMRDAADSDAERRLIICLGDYIDRGADSYGVIEHLRQRPPESFERICLMGNHESYLLRFIDDSSVAANWLDNGGAATLSSYGVRSPARLGYDVSATDLQATWRSSLPASHEEFLHSLVSSHREGDYFFTHAGVRPGVPLDRQDSQDLMWIRDEFTADKRDFGAVVVHGHTIVVEPENLPNRIGVDTGAYETGRLTCAVLQGRERRFLVS
ncbi:MAG: serine/threonine protein phosphatase [Alphaproteobacteria bacterium]|nr:serine/threonine protein phosphatase [Alphaproteobacteria bacterium]